MSRCPEILVVAEGEFETELVSTLHAEGLAHVARRCADAAEVRGAAAAGLGEIAVVDRDLVSLDVVADLERAGMRVIVVGGNAVARTVDAVIAALLGTATDETPGAMSSDVGSLTGAALAAQLPPDPFTEAGSFPVPPPAPPSGAAASGAHTRYPPRSRRRAAAPPETPREEPAVPTVPEAPAPHRGEVIVVAGPAGAPGRTTLALALAADVAQRGLRVLLIDADTVAPGIVYLLALPDESAGIIAATYRARNGELDALVLGDLVDHTAWGFDVVTGIEQAQRWKEVDESGLAGLLRVARECYDLVLVDTAGPVDGPDAPASYYGPARDAARAAALAECDRHLVVGAGDPLGMRRLLGYLRDFPSERGLVVVNRLDSLAAGVGAERGARHILARYGGIDRAFLVRRDPTGVARAQLDGTPMLASDVGDDIAAIADALVGERAPRRDGGHSRRRGAGRWRPWPRR
ncbi:hypothetical protein H8R18_01935 [Nanchangia anserum]|uniref:AAA+ ATPase domain-containing protein n=1 Tax=Nanchangia anserum TaxID=2692125 RepID=A0A8I0GD42_9ACTO|nr:hypothetical protein [Nanchangia anserum]MBD3690061.1 hypothetical protein [Nanchangia anserum]QOX82145.1 hypothetical protein H8R18_01935 [Nanchangia anserum]